MRAFLTSLLRRAHVAPETTDSIIADLTEKVKRLATIAENKDIESRFHQRQADLAHDESLRASRIAGKLNDLLS